MDEITKAERKSVSYKLRKFCHHAKESSFIEVTEWTNGEGWDIVMDDRHIALTYGELKAIQFMTDYLDYV